MSTKARYDDFLGRFREIVSDPLNLLIRRSTNSGAVHEPLEEFIFQKLVDTLPRAPSMLELGAYWGHYSMWLKSMRPDARVTLVEPDGAALRVGMSNFERNGLTGEFLQAFVCTGQFEVDRYLSGRAIPRIDILHADIQGYELEMLAGCATTLGD